MECACYLLAGSFQSAERLSGQASAIEAYALAFSRSIHA